MAFPGFNHTLVLLLLSCLQRRTSDISTTVTIFALVEVRKEENSFSLALTPEVLTHLGALGLTLREKWQVNMAVYDWDFRKSLSLYLFLNTSAQFFDVCPRVDYLLSGKEAPRRRNFKKDYGGCWSLHSLLREDMPRWCFYCADIRM